MYRSSLGFKYWNYFVWGVERLQIIDLHFIPFRSTILWRILDCENVGFIANMWMFERRWLVAVGEMENWIELTIYRYICIWKIRLKIRETPYLFTCLVVDISVEMMATLVSCCTVWKQQWISWDAWQALTFCMWLTWNMNTVHSSTVSDMYLYL